MNLLKQLRQIETTDSEQTELAGMLPDSMACFKGKDVDDKLTLEFAKEYATARPLPRTYKGCDVRPYIQPTSTLLCPLTGLPRFSDEAPDWEGVNDRRIKFVAWCKHDRLSGVVADAYQVAVDMQQDKLPARYQKAWRIGKGRGFEPHAPLEQVDSPVVELEYSAPQGEMSLKQKRQLLAGLCSGRGDLRIVCGDAGLNIAQLDLSGSPETAAANVLNYAASQGPQAERAIWGVLRGRYPNNPELWNL